MYMIINVILFVIMMYTICLGIMYQRSSNFYSKASEYYHKASKYYYSSQNYRADEQKNKGDYWYKLATRIDVFFWFEKWYERLGDKG